MENNFSLFDSLGSQRVTEDPRIDAKSFQPFEGREPLRMPTINFPISQEPIYSVGSSVIDYKQRNKPSKPNQPNPYSVKNPNSGQALLGHVMAPLMTGDKYSKTTSYDSGSKGAAFYDRYRAYGDETFDKIGFNPFRDNEKTFNLGTSTWDDVKRMASHSFAPLFAAGFTSGPKSLWKAMQGDFSGDTEEAEIYERANAIGQSSKKGFGAFMSNTALNFGYTAGIITEVIAEELILAAATAVTAGAAGGVAGARTGANIARIGKAFSGIKGFDLAADASRTISQTVRRAGQSIQESRNIFSTINGNKVLSFLNPLENTTSTIEDLNKLGSFKDLAKSYGTYTKTAGALYRDARALNMALAESRLEGGFVENEVFDELYKEYKNANKGELPDEDLEKQFRAQAKNASATSVLANTGIIFVSNKMVLDNLVGRKAGISRWLNSKIDDVKELGKGSIRNVAKETTLKSGRKFNTLNLQWTEKGLKTVGKDLMKDPFRQGLKGLITYSKANIMEGLQENTQEVIAEASKNFYVNSFNDPTLNSMDYAKHVTLTAAKGQFTKQGFETFASGFAMGIFGGGMNKVVGIMQEGISKYSNPEQYKAMKEAQAQFGKAMVDNAMSMKISDFFDSKMFNLGAQVAANKAMQSGTTKEAFDAADMAFATQVTTAAKNGTLESLKDYVESMKGLTPQELEEVLGVEEGTGENYLKNIDNTISKIDQFAKRKESIDKSFPNPINKEALDPSSPTFEEDFLLHQAWETAKDSALIFGELFNSTGSRMTSIIDAVTQTEGFEKLGYNDLKILFEPSNLSTEVAFLRDSIKMSETNPSLTTEQRKELTLNKKKLEKITAFEEQLNNYVLGKSRYRAQALENLKQQEKFKDLSDEEITEGLNEKYGDLSEESAKKRTSNLEKAYKEYLKVLGEKNEQFIFNDKVDKTFGDLLDFYDLKDESEALASSINLLSDPKAFQTQVEKNRQWMKDMYDNRKSYYEKMVSEGIANVETNQILNLLHQQGIYISMEDLEAWQQDKIIPSEFINDNDKTVITKGMPQYDEYADLFIRIAKDSVKVEINDNELNEKLDTLKTEREEALSKVSTIKTEQEVQVINNITHSELVQLLKPNQIFKIKIEGGTDTYKLNKKGQLVDNFGDLLDLDKIGDVNIEEGILYDIIEEPNQEEIDKINKEFDAKESELKSTFSFEAASGSSVTVYDTTNYTENPALTKELKDAFELTEIALNSTEEEYEDAFNSWVATEGLSIIDNFNNQSKPKTQPSKPESKINVNINGKVVDLSQLSLEELKNYREIVSTQLSDLRIVPVDTSNQNEDEIISSFSLEEEVPTRDQQAINELTNILNLIDSIIEKRENNKAFTDAQQEVLDNIKINILDQQSRVDRSNNQVTVDGIPMNRVTNVIKSLLDQDFYSKELKNIKASYKTILEKDFTSENIDKFIQDLKDKKLPGFTADTYKAIKEELNKFITTPQSEIEAKKADIERRRQEELRQNLSKTDFATSLFPAFSQSNMSQGGGAYVEINFGKNNIFRPDTYLTPSAINKQYPSITDGKATIEGEMADGTKIALPWNQLKDLLNSIKAVNIKGEVVYEFDINKINAKYDAELKALEEASTTQNINKEDILEKLEQTVLSNIYKDSTDAGNYIDEQIKNAFNNKPTTFSSSQISDTAYNNLFGEEGVITKIKELQEKEGFVIISDGLTVFDKEQKIAGEIDLLAVDKNGNVFIIDVKTSKNWNNFKGSDKEKQYKYQQGAYANLLFNMTNLNSKISLMPFEVKLDEGKIIDINTPQDQGYRINLELSTKEQDNLNSLVNRTGVSVTQKEDITEENKKKYEELLASLESMTIDELKVLAVDLFTKDAYDYLTTEQYQTINNIILSRTKDTSSTKTEPTTENDIKVGEVYILNTDVQNYPIGTSVKVLKVEGDNITVKKAGKGKHKEVIVTRNNLVNFEESDNNNMEDQTINPEIKDNSTESLDILDSFVADSEELDRLDKYADSKTLEELKNELLNNLKC